ncbi:MAG TPA: hypothetical protein VJ950_10725 [Acidimicrobiia bacterium]|nr:hypothetical protein [Acidimicrobiia bacterium]
MLDRMSWFVTGVLVGGWITVRALRRSPTPGEWKDAAAATGADLLDLAANAVRPNRSRQVSVSR